MKKFTLFKTLELLIFLGLTAYGLFIVFTDSELYHLIAVNAHVKLLCTILWIVLGLSFIFIFFDFNLFSSLKKDYSELDYAVHSDPVSGIANRYSCDSLIEKYLDKPLPEDLGCIMLELTNIAEINKLYGHYNGNELIREFSTILKLTSVDLCFVGRNGGNKFLAIFEECTDEKIKKFLSRVEHKIKIHNGDLQNNPIEYRCGVAFREGDGVSTITELIALSNRRIADGK